MTANKSSKNQKAKKRSLLAELEEGMQALKAHREGELTLREHTVRPHGDPTQATGKCSMEIFVVVKVWYSRTDLIAAFFTRAEADDFVARQDKPINFEIQPMTIGAAS